MAFDPLTIDPGELRHRVTIMQPSTMQDADGQFTSSWSTLLITWAKIDDAASNTFKFNFQGSVLAANSTDVLTIRWPGQNYNIAPGMQVIFADMTFVIQDVSNVLHRNRVLHLACVVQNETSN